MTAQNTPSAALKKRARDIVRLLRRTYPNAHTELKHRSPLELLIATILSAQCTDKKVNEITEPLFKKYSDAAAFARAEQSVLEQEIRSTGFYRTKAAHIIAAANIICDSFDGCVPDSMQDLVRLPGVARKTANIVLAGAFHQAVGIAVDTHVKRLAGRMGLSTSEVPDKIEQDLMTLLPQSFWLETNFVLVNHGRATCMARKPRCSLCVVRHLCPYDSALTGLKTHATPSK
jgi:endonuclease-3